MKSVRVSGVKIRTPSVARKTILSAPKVTAPKQNSIPRKVNVKTQIKSAPKNQLTNLRNYAVRKAWQDEQKLVKLGGGTRDWSQRQRLSMKRVGKVLGYEGHHIRSVNGHAKNWASDSRNIKFVTRPEHIREHGGNYQNNPYGQE